MHDVHDKLCLSTLVAALAVTLLASPALAQETAPAGGLSAPVVQVPAGGPQQQAQQPQAQQAQVQQQQAPQQPYPQPQPAPAPVQQVQVPQQSWGYAYQPQGGYPVGAYGYQVPTQQQPQFHFEERERATRRLWLPGVILFGLGWVGDFAIATPLANSISDERDPAIEQDAWAWSVVPIVGPIAQLVTGAPHPAIPVTMGLMQIGGLALFIAGMLTKETVQVRVMGPPDGHGTTVDLDAVPVQGGGMLQVTVGHL